MVVWQVENVWKPPLVGVCVWVPCWYVPLRGSRLGFYTLPLTRLCTATAEGAPLLGGGGDGGGLGLDVRVEVQRNDGRPPPSSCTVDTVLVCMILRIRRPRDRC